MVCEIDLMPASEFDEWVEYLGEIKPEAERKARKEAERKARNKGRRR